MTPAKKCDLCDTVLEFEQDGQRLVFTAHDAAFCALATKDRIRMLTQALEGAARDRAEAEGSLRRKLYRQDVEIELLRELVDEAADTETDWARCRAMRRALRDREGWEQRVAERMKQRQQAEARDQLLEMQRLGAVALAPATLTDVP